MTHSIHNWRKLKIGQLGRIVTGKTPPTNRSELFGDKYPFITPTDISDNLHTVKTARYLSEEGRQFQKNNLLPAGAVCYTCIASIGKICLTTESSFTNQQINSVIVDSKEHDNRFVYHLLRNETNRIKPLASGAATPIISKSSFSDIEVLVPPLPTQHAIASILSAYDDLIENNTRRIKILEQIAQAIYREWFVEFRAPGVKLHKATSDEKKVTGKDQFPVDWELTRVADFGDVITGKTPSKAVAEYFSDYMPFIKIPDMHGNMFCIHTEDNLSELGANSQKGKILPANSICVSCIATAGLVTITTAPSQTNQQINSVVLNDQTEREFLYFTLVELSDLIKLYGSNGATVVNLNKGKFEALPVVRPDKQIVSGFHDLTYPMLEQVKALQLKNANLRRTRDLLLPRLISGEIVVEPATS